MSVKQNRILAITTIFLFVMGIIVFTLEQPYWYYSIIILFIAILIPILKVMWNIAGWGDKQYQRYFGDHD